MKLLLDTHVLIWSQETPARLGRKTSRLLADSRNDVLVSAASALEIARLVHLGQIIMKVGLGAWLERAFETLQARSLVIDNRIALDAYALPGTFHEDPADRLLVATARCEAAVVITADKLILEYSHVKVADARR
jgi:PIN domain nuclease of toxin-antitoxin system